MRLSVTFFCMLAAACSGPPGEPADAAFRQWQLPGPLREISGLALDDRSRLFAVADEQAIVYQVDYESGRLVKAFAFGAPIERGDFEGIAITGDGFWLMTSAGDLLRAGEGDDGDQVAFERIDTGLGDECEFEGLASFDAGQRLALVCKVADKGRDLSVFVWDVGRSALDHGREFELPEKEMEDALDTREVNPSGIDFDPENGRWLILAARQHAVFSITADGADVQAIMRLDRQRHPQAEGIALARDGSLLIADEGGNGQGRLAVYRTTTGKDRL